MCMCMCVCPRPARSWCDQSVPSPLVTTDTEERQELGLQAGGVQSRGISCDLGEPWGISLQARGFATAVRVLLADADGPAPDLTRQEAVALVVTLERLSASLAFVRELL